VESGAEREAIWSTPTRPEDLEPFRIRGGSRGCLLLHGFAGTPPEVRELGEHLARNGYDVLAPVLAGHGRTPQAMRRTRWPDWVASAEQALATLRRDCHDVFVGGQSLGGSIALHLAAAHPDLSGVVSLAAMGSRRFFRDPRLRAIRVIKYLIPWQVPNGQSDLGDPQRLLALHSYARRPTVCLESLMHFLNLLERELPLIQVPALVMHGRRDQTVPIGNGPFIVEHLGSPDRAMVWWERSGHALTVDLERSQLNDRILRWLEAH
jgi:carboxylesterase